MGFLSSVCSGVWSVVTWCVQQKRHYEAIEYNGEGKYYGNPLRADKDLLKAIENFNTAIALDPEYADAYYYRGEVYYREFHNNKQAIADYTKAIEYNEEHDMAYFHRGLSYHEIHRYDEAIKDYTKVIELNIESDDVAKVLLTRESYFNRGNTYLAMQRYEEAIADYDMVLEITPYHGPAFDNRDFAQQKLQTDGPGSYQPVDPSSIGDVGVCILEEEQGVVPLAQSVEYS